MRIAVYAIALNESANVGPWFESIAGQADHVLLVDTGSTDDTLERAEALDDVDLDVIRVKPWRFDAALNAAVALLPDDIDLCVRVDLDMRLTPGWRAELERVWELDGVKRIVTAWFNHGDGPGAIRYRHSLIHARHGFRWKGIVHELLVADPRVSWRKVDSELEFVHLKDETKDRSFILDSLAADHLDNPHDARIAHYYGRELMYEGAFDAAIKILTGHATSGDGDAEERCQSWIYVGDCMIDSMPLELVPTGPYAMATITCPERREGWLSAAELAKKQGRWADCLEAALRALTITEKSWYFTWAWAWGALPYDLVALASHRLGDQERAVEYGSQALALVPADERLQKNLEVYVAARDAGG